MLTVVIDNALRSGNTCVWESLVHYDEYHAMVKALSVEHQPASAPIQLPQANRAAQKWNIFRPELEEFIVYRKK